MKIFYGISNKYIDVTQYCLSNLTKDNIITICWGDEERAKMFTDPFINVVKKIFIVNNNQLTEYDHNMNIQINLINNTIATRNENDIAEHLKIIQSKLKLDNGNFDEELPEQKMAVRYLSGNEKVLEIGGNIGRNSLIIASILVNSINLVTLECDTDIAIQLSHNRDQNNLNFNIENAALSNRRLIQKGWDTLPSDTLLEGYNWVNTITLDDLKRKYNIAFDTLVLDCEGAFYYILMDMPEILDNIKLIIMENDYWDLSHKKYVDETLILHNFTNAYNESGGWGPCYNNFFQVWSKP